MGKVDGSAFEIWVYPYKVLHNLQTIIYVNDREESPYPKLSKFVITPEYFEREFIGEQWIIRQQIFPAYQEPLVFIIYTIQALTDITLELQFTPDLSPMWPASIGGKYVYWDREGYFVLAESQYKNFAIFGGFPGEKIGRLPAHKLPGGKLRYRIPLKKGNHEIPLLATAKKAKFEKVKNTFKKALGKHQHYLIQRKEIIKSFYNTHTQIITPESQINKALKWALWNVNSAFVANPDLGEGLIAGYGLSGERERPGFAWFFGGDGLINSFALVNYGDFAGAKKEVEFLLKYQREDGKIMHELSQGAAFINWFKDYGFPYFHGDTTLYFIIFLDFYIKRTGDKKLLLKHQKKINKIYSWLLKCDTDKDGIVETKLAGVGASETGPLRQKMKTDIYLASLSVKAWQGINHIYSLLNDSNKVKVASSRFRRSKQALERMFWNAKNQYYAYAVKEKNLQVKEVTIWPAIAMRFNVLDPIKGKMAQKKIASPHLSTDWGTRFLNSKSKYYNPISYNNGAVWPFLTGFSSLALYNYNNPYHAEALLRANLNIILDHDYGSPAELLNGEIYRPLDQSVPNQIWSSGNTLSAFIEGLLGFNANVFEKNITFKPAIPLNWKFLQVNNLKVGKGKLNFSYQRVKNRLLFIIHLNDLQGFQLDFIPQIPALKKNMYIDGKKIQSISHQIVPLKFQKVNISIDISRYIFPYIPKNLKCGKFSKDPIIEDLQLQPESFTLTLWGKGKVKLHLLSDLNFECSEGKKKMNGEDIILSLIFNDQWEKKSIICRIIK